MIKRGLKRSFGDFKLHPWLHVISVSTIAASLILLGVFFLVSRNLQGWAERARAQTTGTVYLRESLPDTAVDDLKNRILQISGVRAVVFKTKQSLMQELQGFLGGEVSENLNESEIFPDVLEVEMKKDITAVQIETIRSAVIGYPEVSEADFSEDWFAQFTKVRRFFHIFGIVLSTGMVIGCGFIVANFMGLRHQSRKNEIEIIRLHGANRFFVLLPFLWEGFIEGILGSALSIILLYGFKGVIATMLSAQWSNLLGGTEIVFLSAGQAGLVILLGVVMAFFGSFTVFLRFQENP